MRDYVRQELFSLLPNFAVQRSPWGGVVNNALRVCRVSHSYGRASRSSQDASRYDMPQRSRGPSGLNTYGMAVVAALEWQHPGWRTFRAATASET